MDDTTAFFPLESLKTENPKGLASNVSSTKFSQKIFFGVKKNMIPISKNFSYACSICESVNPFCFKKSSMFARGTLVTSAFRIRLTALSTTPGGSDDDSKKKLVSWRGHVDYFLTPL